MQSDAGRLRRCVVFLLLFLCHVWNASALTLYVSLTGAAIPPYTNWARAARTIQDAVDMASNGDLILVADGIYATGNRLTPGGNTLNRLVITNDVVVQGLNGASKTIIAGNHASAITESIRCVYVSGDAKLIGLTLTNGSVQVAGRLAKDFCGGGLYFDSNTGGGAYHCVIAGNRTESTNGQGGGIFFYNSYADLHDSVIAGNEAGGGGGMQITGGRPNLVNLVIKHNQALGGGGGMLLYHSDCILQNILMTENASLTEGGGLYLDGCKAVMENMTIAGNTAPPGQGGGMRISFYSSPHIRNCILWNNRAEQIAFDNSWRYESVAIAHSDIQGGPASIPTYGAGPVNWRQGNIDTNPLFGGRDDYTLQVTSPCINAGVDQGWMNAASDLAGHPRILGDRVDMGAYEFGERPFSSDWITQIGFSAQPDGDQDVTLFYRDERLWITVSDIGPDPNKPLVSVFVTLSQPWKPKYIFKIIQLKPVGPDRFVGSVALRDFRPGDVSVAISGYGSRRVLYRLSAIRVQ